MQIEITKEDLDFIFSHGGKFINLSNGGLVIGKSHEEGGIKLCKRIGDKYYYFADMEGYEFIVNPYSTQKYMERLKEINSYNEKTELGPLDNNKTYSYFDFGEYDIALISDYNQFIINKNASMKFLDELTDMNNEIFNIFK